MNMYWLEDGCCSGKEDTIKALLCRGSIVFYMMRYAKGKGSRA